MEFDPLGAPAALLAIRVPPERARSQLALAAIGFGAVLGVAAAALARRRAPLALRLEAAVEVRLRPPDDPAELEQLIETFYNPRRLHSSLGHRSPDDYERIKLNEETAAVA